MKREFPIKIHRRWTSILIGALLLMLLSLVVAGDETPVPSRPRNRPVPEARKQNIARGLAGSFGLVPFQPSLEMKENADFFLTPALLVQEALSNDVIITYPTE